MPRILKGNNVYVDSDNRVSVETSSKIRRMKSGSSTSSDDAEENIIVARNIVADAQIEADAMLLQANVESMRMLEEASEKLVRLEAEAKENGYQTGYDEGYESGVSESEHLVKEAENLRETYEDNWVAVKKSAEPQMFKIVMNIFEKLFGKYLDLNPDVILNLIRQGFDESNISGKIIIRVSTDDYDYTLEHKEEVLEMLETSVEVEFAKDVNLVKGDCVIETEFGYINSSLGYRFEEIRKNLQYIYEDKDD